MFGAIDRCSAACTLHGKPTLATQRGYRTDIHHSSMSCSVMLSQVRDPICTNSCPTPHDEITLLGRVNYQIDHLAAPAPSMAC